MPNEEDECAVCQSRLHNRALCRRHRILNGLSDRCVSDVTIRVEDRSYQLDRTLLATFSPYFDAMFNRPFVESKLSSVELCQVSRQPFEILLEFMEGGDPRTGGRELVLLEAVDLADRICLDLFLSYHDEELDSNLEAYDMSLAYGLCLRLGKYQRAQDILDGVRHSLLSLHFRTCGRQADDRVLEETNHELLLLALHDSWTSVDRKTSDLPCSCTSTEKLLDGILHWVVRKPGHRLHHLEELLGVLRVREMSEEAILDSVLRVLGSEFHVSLREDVMFIIKDARK